MIDAARAHADLRAIYTRIDALLEGYSCDASTACCRFGVTGREPYVTSLELDVLVRAVRARGHARPPTRKRLPLATEAAERRCPLLGEDDRCVAYEARPFGCRTFFCERALREHAPGKLPRRAIADLLRELSRLSETYDPRNGRGAPLTHALTATLVERRPKPRY